VASYLIRSILNEFNHKFYEEKLSINKSILIIINSNLDLFDTNTKKHVDFFEFEVNANKKFFSTGKSRDLIDFNKIDLSDLTKYVGPTHYSNWMIPNMVLMGRYPGFEYKVKSVKQEIGSIIGAGVTTFVCLIGEFTNSDYETD